MEKLKTDLDILIDLLPDSVEFREKLRDLESVYPFNEYEYIIATLVGSDILSLEEYYHLRAEYMSRNLYLYVFEISAPRNFGEQWAQGQLKCMVPNLQFASKKLDPTYSGQYDFWLEGIRIEVKASRAVDAESNAPLYLKALTSDSTRPFDMNFQQIKPGLCDVFVWLGVWRDQLRFWVLTAAEVAQNRYYSTGQHRGNVGEGQLHLKHDNLQEFQIYEVHPSSLYQAILAAGQRQLKTKG